MDITTDTSREELARLSAAPRGSDQRRRTLERLAGVCTDVDTSVSIRFSESEASCCEGDEATDADYIITLPTRKYEQVYTELADWRWDKRVQIALLFHELGHVKYSDFERFEQRKTDFDPRWRNVFQHVYNAAEDGVIERQIAKSFHVGEDFRVLNETLAQLETKRHEEYARLFVEADHTDVTWADMPLRYTILEAMVIGILDRAHSDSGRFREIVDPDCNRRVVRNGQREVLTELEPTLDEYATAMLAEPDGSARINIAASFVDDIRSHLSSLPPVQTNNAEARFLRPADADIDDPNRAVGNPKSATALPGEQGARRYVTANSSSSQQPRSRQNTTPNAEASRYDDGRLRDRSSASPQEQEAAQLLGFVSNSSTDVDRAGVVEIEKGRGDRERWQRAKRKAARLAADLRGRLRRERRTQHEGGFRSGRLDPHRVVHATQGTNRVFTRRTGGNEKDYSCLIVLDRSNSMAEVIDTAENAVAQLVHAFGSVGVDVSVLSVYSSRPWLEIPFGSDPSEYADHLLTGRYEGGTPLSSALAYARDRVRTGDGTEPMVIVVTDGYPNDEESYVEQLDRCSFGVYGVYIGSDERLHRQLFDRIVYSDDSSLDTTLRTMARTFVSQ